MFGIDDILGGVGSIGGLIGSIFGGGDDNGAANSQGAAIAAIQGLQIPEIDKALLIHAYNQAGTLTPEMIQKLNLNADTKTLLLENPENRSNQQASLNALKQLSQTGMSAEDFAQMQQMRSQAAQDTSAKQAQILQQAQMRGQLGGGDSLAAQLMANQASGQATSKGAINQAAQAAAARREALNNYASLAGQVRGQDFNTQQFNTQNDILRKNFLDQNALARQTANVNAQNDANAYNLQRQQGVADANVKAQNDELKRQAEAKARMFDMQMAKAAGLAGQFKNQSDLASRQNAADAESATRIATGAGNVLGSIGKIFRFEGGRIEGDAPMPGNDIQNDKIPAILSPDEIVIPRTEAKNPKKAKKFVDDLFNSEGKKEKAFDKNEALLSLIAELHGKKK